MCASFTQYKKSLHPGFVVPTIPSYADQILKFSNVWVLMFEKSMGYTAPPPTHCPSPAADHSTRPILQQPTLQAEELYRRALTGSEDQLGAVHPSTLSSVYNLAKLLEYKGSFAEAGFGRLLLLLGPVLLGGDVDVGSRWKLNKWFNSDALLSLGKSVVKIRKMFSLYKCFL